MLEHVQLLRQFRHRPFPAIRQALGSNKGAPLAFEPGPDLAQRLLPVERLQPLRSQLLAQPAKRVVHLLRSHVRALRQELEAGKVPLENLAHPICRVAIGVARDGGDKQSLQPIDLSTQIVLRCHLGFRIALSAPLSLRAAQAPIVTHDGGRFQPALLLFFKQDDPGILEGPGGAEGQAPVRVEILAAEGGNHMDAPCEGGGNVGQVVGKAVWICLFEDGDMKDSWMVQLGLHRVDRPEEYRLALENTWQHARPSQQVLHQDGGQPVVLQKPLD